MSVEDRLVALGIVLPDPPPPFASYVPSLVAGGFVFVSGQVALREDGTFRKGKVGADLTLEEAAEEARRCAVNIMAQMRAAAGSLDRIARIARLTVFVSSAPGFGAQPQVANGASDLLVEVFGDAGRHTRSAVGVSELPLDAAVEIDAIAVLAD